MERRDLIAWAWWLLLLVAVTSVAYTLLSPMDVFGVHRYRVAVVVPGLIVPPPRVAKRLLALGRS